MWIRRRWRFPRTRLFLPVFPLFLFAFAYIGTKKRGSSHEEPRQSYEQIFVESLRITFKGYTYEDVSLCFFYRITATVVLVLFCGDTLLEGEGNPAINLP